MKNRQGSLTPHQYEAIARMVRGNNLFVEIGADIGNNIFDGDMKAGLLIKGLKGFEDGLIVEYRSQEVAGSTDEKITFLILNILEKYPHPTVVILDGNGWREGALRWVEKCAGDKLIEVNRSVGEFNNWFFKQMSGGDE